MEPRDLLWNVRVSKTEREEITKLAERLGVKDSKAFRFAIKYTLKMTDPKKYPDALKDVMIVT